MSTPNKQLLTRKDIAGMLTDCTVEQVRKNEKAWGLKPARADLNKRSVRYRTTLVLRIFRSRGWI